MKTSFFQKRLPAYTLVEILVVLGIIGLLIALVMPDQTDSINKARATEAKQELEALYTKQSIYRIENHRFSTSLEDIGYRHHKLETEGGRALYRVEIIEADAHSFLGRATSVVDFDGNGQFNTWEINQDKLLKETVKD